MEYHFTGTGDSPDFTFIADAIVDSVGNRIFYSTIKKTKIKVKGKGKLKSPSTAKFCSVTEATIGCSGNTWVVRGWVDAQNGFGATVRTQFAVTFTFASKDMYSLDSCIVT